MTVLAILHRRFACYVSSAAQVVTGTPGSGFWLHLLTRLVTAPGAGRSEVAPWHGCTGYNARRPWPAQLHPNREYLSE